MRKSTNPEPKSQALGLVSHGNSVLTGGNNEGALVKVGRNDGGWLVVDGGVPIGVVGIGDNE